jgi:Uma2 family endonuclease
MAIATRRIGPADHGRKMSLKEFIKADFEEGWLYELARGVIDVTEVPGTEHGRCVWRTARLFIFYDQAHPGIVQYQAGGMECRLRLPGMQSDRHPDQTIYLDPQPAGKKPWTRWVPHIVVEIISEGSEHRDYVEKREEYLRVGVREYWILDPFKKQLLVLRRDGDVWNETVVKAGRTYRTPLLPGLVVRPSELLGLSK